MKEEVEYYRLPSKTFTQAQALRQQNKYTMKEIADKLSVSLEDLLYDFHLRQRELDQMDD